MSDDGKTGGGKPIVELLHAIGERYQISGIEDRDEIRREVIFSLQNEISKEDALRFIDPSFPPDVIRELLLARLEGVPADRLEEIRTLDVKESIHVSRIRKRYYEELLQDLKKQEESEETQIIKTGVVENEQAEADTSAMNELYAKTLHQFVSEIRLLVADQQKANQAAMELITRKESDEKEEYITLMRLQEKEIESLREGIEEKDDRISSLQEEVQVQIAKMLELAEKHSMIRAVPGAIQNENVTGYNQSQTESDSLLAGSSQSIQNMQGSMPHATAADAQGKESKRGIWKRSSKASGKDQEKELLFALLCKPEIDLEQMEILQNAYEDGVPIDKIQTIGSGKLSAERMKKALKVYGLKDR